jgi:glycosyltransferase involved in cell wall biosynthesis
MNILHVYKTCLPYTQGGVEEVIYQLCRATTQLGVTNRVVCISDQRKKNEVIQTPGATVYCYPMSFEIASCGFSWSLWQDFRHLSEWADLIHYQFPWPFADILALTRQCSAKPYVVSYQSDIVRQQKLNALYRPLMNKFLENAASVVATSPKYLVSSPVLKSLKQPAVFIPNGIDQESNQSTYQKEIKDYEKLYGPEFFLFIGVFRYYKGLKYLLEAAKKTGLVVVIAGDGPEAGVLHRFAQENDLSNVHFLGHVSDKQKQALIHLSTALILPSSERSEAYGVVLVEAARQGTAMISTELGSGTSYINLDQQTGLVVAPKNADELANAMTYLSQNSDVAAKMAENAKERFLSVFTADIMGKRYFELYQTILAENNFP